MVSLWTQAKQQARYFLYGPGSNTPSRAIIPVKVEPPPLRTSLVFESHIVTEAQASSKGKLPQTISSAWDERRNWADDTQQSWQGLTAQDRKNIMLDIYLNTPAASSCVDVISKRIFSGGLVVEKIDEEGPDNKQHYDTLMEFCLRVNQDWDFLQLGRSLVSDELIFGESYAEILWKNGLPWNLVKVDCIPMGYKANRWGQIEQFYQQLESNRQKNWLDPQNIIRWWFPHPRASIDPFAPVEKVTDAVLLANKMSKWQITFFQKGAKFPFYVKGVSDQDEADRYMAFFTQNNTGEKNAHKPMITWGTAELAALGNMGAMDIDFEKGMDRADTIVYGSFGVPPAAVSIVRTGAMGGHSEAEQDKLLIFNACDPVKGGFFEKLNDRVSKRGFGITDYRISSHYADYRSDKDVSETEDKRIRNGSRTINEIRTEGGKRPYKDGGDVAVIVTTKEVTPVPRLDDMEEEQRQTAQVTLDTAKAGADLAQTKAKQAKEPPPEQPPAMPGQTLQKGQQPVAQKATANQKQKPVPQEKQQEAVTQLSLLDAANESQGNTGVMVALMIPGDVAQQIAIAGGEPVEDLHITLGYLGDMADLDSERIGYLKSALKYFAASRQPLAGRIAGLGRFDGPEEEPSPVIALPDIPGLPAFRQQLIAVLAACETPAHQNHGYTPHITLAYIDVAVSMPITSLPHLNLYFDAICLVVGDERTYFPLLGQKQEDYNPITKVWEPDDTDQQIEALRIQGVTHVRWDADAMACDECLGNDGQVVKLGEAFKGGQRLVIGHPNCNCRAIYLHGAQEEEQDKDATQKIPVVKKQQKVELTDSDLWDGRP